MAQQARRDVFQAIADPTRRDILSLIANEPMNLNAIAENFKMSRPAISQHIKILVECELIVINEQGRERYCEMQVKQLAKVADWLEPFRKIWTERFDALDQLLAGMQAEENKKKKK